MNRIEPTAEIEFVSTRETTIKGAAHALARILAERWPGDIAALGTFVPDPIPAMDDPFTKERVVSMIENALIVTKDGDLREMMNTVVEKIWGLHEPPKIEGYKVRVFRHETRGYGGFNVLVMSLHDKDAPTIVEKIGGAAHA